MKTSKEFRTATRQICETRIRDGLGFDWRFGAREMANALDDIDSLQSENQKLRGLLERARKFSVASITRDFGWDDERDQFLSDISSLSGAGEEE